MTAQSHNAADPTVKLTHLEAAIEHFLPLHGPYDDDLMRAAGSAMSELTRYLNYATGQGAKHALPHAASASSLLGNLAAMAGGLDQTFRQLLTYVVALQDGANLKASLYDHENPGDPWAGEERASEAEIALRGAQVAAATMYDTLQTAQSALARIGHW